MGLTHTFFAEKSKQSLTSLKQTYGLSHPELTLLCLISTGKQTVIQDYCAYLQLASQVNSTKSSPTQDETNPTLDDNAQQAALKKTFQDCNKNPPLSPKNLDQQIKRITESYPVCLREANKKAPDPALFAFILAIEGKVENALGIAADFGPLMGATLGDPQQITPIKTMTFDELKAFCLTLIAKEPDCLPQLIDALSSLALNMSPQQKMALDEIKLAVQDKTAAITDTLLTDPPVTNTSLTQ